MFTLLSVYGGAALAVSCVVFGLGVLRAARRGVEASAPLTDRTHYPRRAA